MLPHIFQDYRELDMRLVDIPVNEYTSSELLRLVLRPQDLNLDSNSVHSDFSDDDENDQDMIVSESLFWISRTPSCNSFVIWRVSQGCLKPS